ncbi:hypothetical protein FVEG_15897 [Fusarium verticillioides 7600]|uniref:Uncharacterized protein n=1 Tax=Gibberella moniliformis (strain M3125 / FGSC 7600) TaxID=334819 RepID=W7M334_GIBM7|nr:hypothetical protein FVEG_15897 [Fusarium verticillioides 7600]EWG45963.1 hypothetical protein FVEG_15897 [Fusarium verticillioides 7600]
MGADAIKSGNKAYFLSLGNVDIAWIFSKQVIPSLFEPTLTSPYLHSPSPS